MVTSSGKSAKGKGQYVADVIVATVAKAEEMVPNTDVTDEGTENVEEIVENVVLPSTAKTWESTLTIVNGSDPQFAGTMLHILTKIKDDAAAYVAAHALQTGSTDENLTAWIAKQVEVSVNLDDIPGLLKSEEVTAGQLLGIRTELKRYVGIVNTRIHECYAGKVTPKSDAPAVPLKDMRKNIVDSVKNAIGLAKSGFLGPLSEEMIATIPGISSLPTAPKTTTATVAGTTASGVRGTNTHVKVTINGVVPANHPERLDAAIRLYFGSEATTVGMRPDFSDYDSSKFGPAMFVRRDNVTNYVTTDKDGEPVAYVAATEYGLTLV